MRRPWFLDGCCFSRPEGPNSPYPGGAASASARAINPPPHPLPSTSQAVGASADPIPSPSSYHRRRSRRPLDQHINKPLRRHEWASKSRIWTRRTLDRERTEFFDTRVSGREEIWQTLKAALELLWEADAAKLSPAEIAAAEEGSSEQDPAIALATAQSILDAADITLPTGNLANGAYDALGNYYQLPPHVVSDPANMAPDGDDGDNIGDARAGHIDGDDETAEECDTDDDDDDDDELERRREEKGKAVVDVRNQVLVVVRLSETSRDLRLHVDKDENVRSIIRRILDETSHDFGIRLVYLGKMLKENSSLTAQGWKPGQVVNAFMFESSR